MATEREIMKQKIAKLMALGQSTNVSEATIALKKASDLMNAWGLSIDDIELADEKIMLKKIVTKSKNRPEIGSVLVRLAEFASVKVWATPGMRYSKNSKYVINILGYEQDLELFEYFYNMLTVVFETSYEQFKTTPEFKSSAAHGRAIRKSFSIGFCNSVNGTLRSLIDEAKQVTTKSGTALIPLKMGNINQYFKDEYGFNLRKSYGRSYAKSANGYAAGTKSGENVTFSTPVNGNGSVKAIAAK